MIFCLSVQMRNREAFVGFATGGLIKAWDDINDMYGAESFSPHLVKLIEVILAILLFRIYQSDNYFVQIYVVLNALYAIVCPNAYFADPYFAALTLVITPLSLHKAVTMPGPKSIKQTLLFLAIGYINVFTFFATEFKQLNFCDTLLACPGLQEDMEVSRSKLAYRLINVLFCGFMLWKGNNYVVDFLGVEDPDFTSLLPIVSWASIGYFGVSVVNQAIMIYLRGVEQRKTQSRSTTDIWSTILGSNGEKIGTGKKIRRKKKARKKKAQEVEKPAGDSETTVSAAIP